MNDKLWRDEDVAEYLGVSTYTVRRKLFCKSTFQKQYGYPLGELRERTVGGFRRKLRNGC